MRSQQGTHAQRALATKALLIVVVAVTLFALNMGVPSLANATRGLETGFQGSTPLSGAADVNARFIKIELFWSDIAPTRPLVPTNPADPSYSFNFADDWVKQTAAHGLEPLLSITYAPAWAEGSDKPSDAPDGTWKPNPSDYRDFAEALARRYSGHFAGLPRVRYFEVWNEPNLTLTPQWSGKQAASPTRFRRLTNAFYEGIKKAQPNATVVAGALAPYGDPPGGARMHPYTFLRNFFCLGKGLKPTKCPSPPHLDALSDHPINTSGGPDSKPSNPNDIVVANFDRVTKVLRAAERAHHVLPRGRHELWADEFWWTTRPYLTFVVPSPRKQAYWIEEGFYLLWRQGASVAGGLSIQDPSYDPKNPSLQTGIFFPNGKRKPSYYAFRFPFVTHRVSPTRIGVWGRAPRAGSLKIQKRVNGDWRTLEKLDVTRGEVVSRSLKLGGAAKLRGEVGGIASLPWRQGG